MKRQGEVDTLLDGMQTSWVKRDDKESMWDRKVVEPGMQGWTGSLDAGDMQVVRFMHEGPQFCMAVIPM